jgi:hypothetical protein
MFGLALLLTACGDMPPDIPDIRTGSLNIIAEFNQIPSDSVSITLDDNYVGRYKNPHVINDIEAGLHKVYASDNELIGESRIVLIKVNEQTEAEIKLFGEGPFVGYNAPDFIAVDIAGRNIRLNDQTGKVIFLFFFEHT